MRTKDSRAVLRGLGRSNAPRLPGELDQSLQIAFVLEAMQRALAHARPQICNSDQGSHFTSPQYTQLLLSHDVRISMVSLGRALDNIFTERLWRTIKYEEVYVKDYASPREAREGLRDYLRFYNERRLHQALGYRTPVEVYFAQANGEQSASREHAHRAPNVVPPQ
jgi:putative transposase